MDLSGPGIDVKLKEKMDLSGPGIDVKLKERKKKSSKLPNGEHNLIFKLHSCSCIGGRTICWEIMTTGVHQIFDKGD
jgi:hypothetical protein